MNVAAVSVGAPREVEWRGRVVETGIFKAPVEGRVAMRTLNIEGDAQADLTVHGGPTKAVYAYPREHYEYWRDALPDIDLTWGVFGENLTTEGLLENEVCIGDRLRIGSGEVMVTEPRMPCFKLGIRFGRPDIVKRFLASRRSGFYFAVVTEGEIGAGDALEPIGGEDHGVTIADITRLYAFERDDLATLRRVVELESLPESWRGHFRKRIDKV